MAAIPTSGPKLEKPKLSFVEKLQLVLCIGRALTSSFVSFLSWPFVGGNRSSAIFKHVAFAALRSFSQTTTVRMIRAIEETTDEAYLRFAKEQKFPPNSVELHDGTKAHWLGKSEAPTVMLYFHGGGYAHYGSTNHMMFLHDRAVKASDGQIGVLFLSYDLPPDYPYPRQLQQAVSVLRYLVIEAGRSPLDIIIGGESAGGNLVLGVLSHISHPHPSISPLKLASPLKAAVLMSPWVSFDNTSRSMLENEGKDCINYAALDQWSSLFLGGKDRDNWNEPGRAPLYWWDNLMAEKVLILAGADEIFVDDIRAFAKGFESIHLDITTFVAEGEAHAQPVADLVFGYTEPGGASQVLQSMDDFIDFMRLFEQGG